MRMRYVCSPRRLTGSGSTPSTAYLTLLYVHLPSSVASTDADGGLVGDIRAVLLLDRDRHRDRRLPLLLPLQMPHRVGGVRGTVCTSEGLRGLTLVRRMNGPIRTLMVYTLNTGIISR